MSFHIGYWSDLGMETHLYLAAVHVRQRKLSASARHPPNSLRYWTLVGFGYGDALRPDHYPRERKKSGCVDLPTGPDDGSNDQAEQVNRTSDSRRKPDSPEMRYTPRKSECQIQVLREKRPKSKSALEPIFRPPDFDRI